MKALIRFGSSGVDVLEIQNELVRRKYLMPGDADGDFGPHTENAVRRFQNDRKLVKDGVVGPVVWGELFPDYAKAETIKRETKNAATYLFISTARKYVGMRETNGPNRSPVIDAWTRELGLNPEDRLPWCMIAVQHVAKETSGLLGIRDILMPNSPGVLDTWNRVPNAWKFGPMDGVAGDVFIMDMGGGKGHTGIIESYSAGVYLTLEGNTNEAGSREGDGFYKKTRKHSAIKGVIRLPWPES